MTAGAVFISYSHDFTEHSDRVGQLADALIEMGLDVQLDQDVRCPERVGHIGAKSAFVPRTLRLCS